MDYFKEIRKFLRMLNTEFKDVEWSIDTRHMTKRTLTETTYTLYRNGEHIIGCSEIDDFIEQCDNYITQQMSANEKKESWEECYRKEGCVPLPYKVSNDEIKRKFEGTK